MARGEYLSEFELYVLLAITRSGGEAPGAEVRRSIEAGSGRRVTIGAVHTTLLRLEEKGFVRFRLSAPEPVRGGRARKFYRLTATGERALALSAEGMSRMLNGSDWAPER